MTKIILSSLIIIVSYHGHLMFIPISQKYVRIQNLSRFKRFVLYIVGGIWLKYNIYLFLCLKLTELQMPFPKTPFSNKVLFIYKTNFWNHALKTRFKNTLSI